jgi:aldehyde:ferredoxin oxidoreductase
MKGYTGKILHVDLSSGSTFVEQPEEKFYRKYLGGSCMGVYYVMHGMPAGVDPLSPGNVMVFSIGPLAGSPISGISRHSVTCKSPLTGTIAASEAGGYWAPKLRTAGFDAIVIKGKAASPVFLWVHDGECEIKDASRVWGKVTLDAEKVIKEELGDSHVCVAQIGPAGENLVKYANIVNELSHFNGRNGVGAVMGSKNLKAIAVGGKGKLDFFNPAVLSEFAKRGAQRATKEQGYIDFMNRGTNVNVDEHIVTGGMPTRNWTSGYFEETENLLADVWRETILDPGTCFACAQSCKRHVAADNPHHLNRALGGPEYETVGMCGSNLGIGDRVAICQINELCSQHAMDTISFGGTVGFAMECFEKGIITTQDTGGLELKFGNVEAVLKLAELTAIREGFGDLIAEGTARLAKKWGPAAEKLAVHVKGKEFPAQMPQVKASLGLAYALIPFGPDHVSSNFDASIGSEPLPYQLVGIGFDRAEDPGELNLEKSKLFWRTARAYSLMDSVGACVLTFGFWTIYDPDDLVSMINAATGWKTNLHEMLMVGERRLQMMRAYNVREGFGPADDILPEKMFTPLKGGATDGVAVNQEAFFESRDYVYELASWDQRTGNPSAGRLRELNLDWVIDYIH